MRWRDPHDGSRLWEPPGGGIEPGETPLVAARRELVEETGFNPALVIDGSVEVHRDLWWNGARRVGPESFFLARLSGHRPSPARDGLLADELATLVEYGWFSRAQLTALPDRLEPPELAAVVAELAGAWA